MRTIQLLDCTLRDGGYINDWNFGHNNLISIFERLVDSKVDIIEIGFLDDRRPFDINRSIMPDTKSAERIWNYITKRPPMIVGMIDYGACRIENIQPCKESFLDGIRVIFKKNLMYEALEYCRQLKELGYIVFAQLVSITSYSDDELLELTNLVNNVKPYAVSMVDTYGLLKPNMLLHYYEILDSNIDISVQIGFHGHNNFQLAYANAISFISKKTERNIVVDGTLYGMGKSAGNAPLELVAMFLNEEAGKRYCIDAMLEAINESVMSFYEKSPWGYKLFYYMCALNKCHPSYLTYFDNRKSLSISAMDELLALINPEEKRLLYDKLVAERLYNSYGTKEEEYKFDREKLKEELLGKEILLVGPGKNAVLQKKQVDSFIAEVHPFVIAVNYIPHEINVDCVFITNSQRYLQMEIDLKERRNSSLKLLAVSTLKCKDGEFDYVINRAEFLEDNENIMDNSFLMLLKLLSKIGVPRVACAGFDGYSEIESNYFNSSMEYSFVKNQATYLNSHMREVVHELRNNIDIRFITYSVYDRYEDINCGSF